MKNLRSRTRRETGSASNRDRWPYRNPERRLLAETLPAGRPWPRISIVTPSFNQGLYLEETILSVRNQGYANVEHIIIDGGSSDESAAILDRYRDSLSYVVSEPDAGQGAAINKGMARASGDILTWLNSDDMLAPGALAGVAMAFATAEADLVAGVCRVYEDGGKPVEQHLTSCADGPLPLEDLLDLERCWSTGQFFYQPEVMFTRRIWERAGAHVDESLFYSMDYELWVRFAEQRARLHVIGLPVACYRRHPGQKTHVPARYLAELTEWRDRYRNRTGRIGAGHPEPVEWRNRLRILLLNDHGYHYGAGIVQRRLGQAIRWAGHEAAAVSLVDQPPTPSAVRAFTDDQVLSAIAGYRPDLVIAGNLHSAKADAGLLAAVGEKYPVLCLVNDFWLITGRCGYPGACRKYLDRCDADCPTPDEYPQLEPGKIEAAWAGKRKLLEKHHPYLLAYSQWAAEFVRTAIPAAAGRLRSIRLSVPLEIFEPRDKRHCRRMLGLPEDRFIVLTASEFRDPRKGLDHLLASLQRLELPDVLLASACRSDPDPAKLGSIPFHRLGYMEDSGRLALAYAAADVLVAPSVEETFGQVFMEAAACGTPAIGYPVTGVAEAIKDGVTGRLAAAVGPEYLAQAILELYSSPELRRNMARWGRLFAENEWSPFSAWHELFAVLRGLGLLDQARCPPKISFVDPRPAPPIVSPISRLPRSGAWRLARNAARRLAEARGSRLAEISALTRETGMLVHRYLSGRLKKHAADG
jgi:glycosyltransferase involved in cell wall biosynthesis